MIGPISDISFRHMYQGTVEDFESLRNLEQNNICVLPDRNLVTFEVFKDGLPGYQFNRFGHFLQMYNFANKLELKKVGRDTYRRHKFCNSVVKFREKWNQISFVPEYLTMNLSYFESIVCEIFRPTPVGSSIIQKHS